MPLLEKLEFFENKLSKTELEQVAQNIKYQYFEPGQTIFKMGDKGDCYYIVMKGRALFSIPRKDYVAKSQTKQDGTERPNSKN